MRWISKFVHASPLPQGLSCQCRIHWSHRYFHTLTWTRMLNMRITTLQAILCRMSILSPDGGPNVDSVMWGHTKPLCCDPRNRKKGAGVNAFDHCTHPNVQWSTEVGSRLVRLSGALSFIATLLVPYKEAVLHENWWMLVWLLYLVLLGITRKKNRDCANK